MRAPVPGNLAVSQPQVLDYLTVIGLRAWVFAVMP
jgi:hypothetical protein